MAEQNNYYTLLSINPDASDEDIKKAYRREATKWHPDKNPHSDTTEQFKIIAQAYEILLDPVTRAQYDKDGPQSVPKPTKTPAEVYNVAVHGFKQPEIDVHIIQGELLNHWNDPSIENMPAKARLGLREDQHFTDLIDLFMDQGRLLHVRTVGRDKRQSPAYQGFSNKLFTRHSHANSASSSI